ncbi:MAG: hypothetical protein ABIT36_01355 [Steroidobacteraceae bacterium]
MDFRANAPLLVALFGQQGGAQTEQIIAGIKAGTILAIQCFLADTEAAGEFQAV